MPRLDTSPSASSESSINYANLFKVLGLIGGISCGIWYIVYQYERLHPTPTAKVKPGQVVKKAVSPTEKRMAAYTKLKLTDDQRKQLESTAATTTDPRVMRREANKILTAEQKATAKLLRDEEEAKRKEQQAQRQAKLQKLFPGDQLQKAQQMNKQIQAETEARKRAAAAAKPTT